MNEKIKKITVVTGTRADYGIYVPILEAIDNDRNFELNLLVTGMHLSPFSGYTINEIKKNNFKIAAKVDILLHDSTGANMAKSIGLGILGMTQALEEINPDLVIVLGDRGEMLAATIAATHQNIAVAHFHGGEVSGSIDESVRHAISKFAHIHFASTKKSTERLCKLGEDPWRVYQVGAPRLDTLINVQTPDLELVKNKYNLNQIDNYCLLVFHPVTTETISVKEQVTNVLEALLEENKTILTILPNSDAGNQEILKVYEKYKKIPNIYFITNFNHLDYLTILKNCELMIGNSSSGIIESASFNVPVINVGSRQNGRERSLNVIDSIPFKENILESIKFIDTIEYKMRMENLNNVYGDGTASERVLEILKKIKINNDLIQKKIAY